MQEFRYIRVEQIGSAIVVRFVESDLSGMAMAESIGIELSHAIAQFAPSRLIIDFDGVKLIASSVIGTLLNVRKRLTQQDSVLLLCRVPVPIREVYRTLNLEGRMLRVFPTVEEAIQAPLTISAPHEQFED